MAKRFRKAAKRFRKAAKRFRKAAKRFRKAASQGGEEFSQGGEEVSQGGEEVSQGGEEVSQGGEEVDVSLLTIKATPTLLLPLSILIPEYVIVLPSTVLNLLWSSYQGFSDPITAKPLLSISIVTIFIFLWIIPLTFHVPVVICLRNEMPILYCLVPSSCRLPEAWFGPPPPS